MDRKDFIKKGALLTAGGIFLSKTESIAEVFSEKKIAGAGFALPQLPYPYEALEPYIDTLTMQIHHQKHHQAYVNNLNKAIEDPNGNNLKFLEEVFTSISTHPSVAVRNNGGGHYNHSLFWTLMKPNGGGEPDGKLGNAIKSSFGSFDEFKKKFSEAALKNFGSGWTWLVVNKNVLDNHLVICSTQNQDNPLMDVSEGKGVPVLALDVWEHAYYLKHQNKRADYISNWWNVVNWEKANELFTSANK